IEDRLSMMEGSNDPIDLANMCLVPDLVFPPKFKVPDFEKYKGQSYRGITELVYAVRRKLYPIMERSGKCFHQAIPV
ncbi:hypothetical protein A2U01_0065738, partial [Trifolium medium]|nr:hypothetical protein [Trifolium medium]